MHTPTAIPATLLAAVADRARGANVFASVTVTADALRCDALDCPDPAFYSITADGPRLFVALQTPARYLSQSIEADLMFTGDKLPDLIHEEMVDLGYADVMPDAPELPFEHFRSSPPEKLYTFRTPLPIAPDQWHTPRAAAIAAIALLGYEAAFRELGNMQPDDE